MIISSEPLVKDVGEQKIISELQNAVTVELNTANLALTKGEFQRAALCYIAAIPTAQKLYNTLRNDYCKEQLAEIYTSLYKLRYLGISDLINFDLQKAAGNIWQDMFNETRLPHYRRKLEEIELLPVDVNDYQSYEQYLKRHPVALAEMSVTLNSYDLLENDAGEIMICMHTVPNGDENDAVLFCDGKDHALLFKGPYRVIICDNIKHSLSRKLPLLKKVYCYEDLNPNEKKGQYIAKVVPYVGVSKIVDTVLRVKNRLN